MSNLTIRQAVQGMLKLQDSGDHATMVGIGPMSPNLIQAVFELAKDEDFPPMFIASRNQVDMDEMGARLRQRLGPDALCRRHQEGRRRGGLHRSVLPVPRSRRSVAARRGA